MRASGKSVIHSSQFTTDCISIFGSVENADSELAFLDAELANELVPFRDIGGIKECYFRSFVVSYKEQGVDHIELHSCTRVQPEQNGKVRHRHAPQLDAR